MSALGWVDRLSLSLFLLPSQVGRSDWSRSLLVDKIPYQDRSLSPFPQQDTEIWPSVLWDKDLRPPGALPTGCHLWLWPVWATELYSNIKEEEGRSVEWATPLACCFAEPALSTCAQIMGPRAC